MVFFSLLPYTTIFDAIGDAAFAQVRKSAFYGKAHSAVAVRRKGAVWVTART